MEIAFGAYLNFNSSDKTKKTAKSKKSSTSRIKKSQYHSHEFSTYRASDKWKDNLCKHCKKFKCNNHHPDIDAKQCSWNPKKERWRLNWICTEMGVSNSGRPKYDSDAWQGVGLDWIKVTESGKTFTNHNVKTLPLTLVILVILISSSYSTNNLQTPHLVTMMTLLWCFLPHCMDFQPQKAYTTHATKIRTTREHLLGWQNRLYWEL